ncbi:hypothetical protein ES705_50425 [subsurface metagenome]
MNKIKSYYKDNREKCLQNMKEWQKDNQEHLKKYRRGYNKRNKLKRDRQNKVYYQQNKKYYNNYYSTKYLNDKKFNITKKMYSIIRFCILHNRNGYSGNLNPQPDFTLPGQPANAANRVFASDLSKSLKKTSIRIHLKFTSLINFIFRFIYNFYLYVFLILCHQDCKVSP